MKLIIFILLILFTSCNLKTERDYGNWSDSTKIKNELFKKQIEEDIEKQLNNK